jgi:hypothetical protein
LLQTKQRTRPFPFGQTPFFFKDRTALALTPPDGERMVRQSTVIQGLFYRKTIAQKLVLKVIIPMASRIRVSALWTLS